jgi:general stress protein 26
MPLHATDKKKHLLDLIRDFDTAMLVTHAPDGELRGRPLSVAEADDDGRLYFAIRIESPAVAELEMDQHVAVMFQDAQRYVALSGTARLRSDRAILERLWNDAWRLWFPLGVADPTLAILEVRPAGAEYWDQTGLAGVRYLFAAMRAYATGHKPPVGADERQNAKVLL